VPKEIKTYACEHCGQTWQTDDISIVEEHEKICDKNPANQKESTLDALFSNPFEMEKAHREVLKYFQQSERYDPEVAQEKIPH
jgi:hypothetical protein